MSAVVGYLISGINVYGAKFRPSDWIDRIASVFATFGDDCRLRYLPYIMPCTQNGERCLFVANDMVERDPAGYQFIMQFVTSNELKMIPLQNEAVPVADLPLANCA